MTASDIEATLQRFIVERVVSDGRAVDVDERLLDEGRVDSMGLLQVLAHIQELYGVDLLTRGDPSDFETIQAMGEAVRRERGSGG